MEKLDHPTLDNFDSNVDRLDYINKMILGSQSKTFYLFQINYNICNIYMQHDCKNFSKEDS